MKYYLTLLLILLFLPISVFAATPNNIYGIHLAQPYPEAIKAAAALVNSTGGDWGYVTVVIQENDRDLNKWQGIFDELRAEHLIPIVRVATSAVGENWRRPEKDDASNWVDFLDSLNWVTKKRYVILFNEPNHGSEWGGEVDEKSFAEVTLEFAKRLKSKNSDFFVMMAGLDASAPSWAPGLEDEEVFLRKTIDESGGHIFDYLDGWSSHSYPNPGFSGSVWDTGRGTIRTYDWELTLLKELGVKKDFPVFITETGWKRGGEAAVALEFQSAFESVWGRDPRIIAVTPFVLDYQGEPFLQFSWKKQDSNDYYQQYYSVQSLSKTKGEPIQVQKGTITFDLPHDLVAHSEYNFKVNLENQGQAIWSANDGYQLKIIANNVNNKSQDNFLINDLKDIKPFEIKSVNLNLQTADEDNSQSLKFILTKNSNPILESANWEINILPLPKLNFKVNFWPFSRGHGDNFEIQIYNREEKLVYKKSGIKVVSGSGVAPDIKNIALGELYRVVILAPGYLPRQSYITFKKEENIVEFKSLLPFDFNHDGKFDFNDIKTLLHI